MEIITNQSYADYAAIDAINMSKLKDIRKSPRHFWAKHINPDVEPKKETEALRFGKILHKFILEPETFSDEYVIPPEEPKADKRTNAGKAIKANFDIEFATFELANPGKEYTTITEVSKLVLMNKSILSKECSQILNRDDVKREVTLIWNCPITDIKCKGRLDAMIEPCQKFPNGVIIDLKSTQDASFTEFSKSAYNFGYHNSAAFYQAGFQQIYKTSAPPPFIYIVIEKESPFEVAFFMADDNYLHLGQQENNQMLETYKRCLETGIWYGYQDEIQTLTLPYWVKIK